MKLNRQGLFILVLISCLALVSATDFNFEDKAGGENNEKIKAVTKRVQTARDTLSKVAAGMNTLAKMAKNSYSILQKFQKILGVLGPVAIAASIVLSIVCAFLPQPDSKELAFMKEKFDVVIGGMLRIESKLGDLENTVIHEVTKAGYGEYQRNIVGLYEDWKDVINAQNSVDESVSRAFFIKQYQMQYKHSAFHLFQAMAGVYEGELNNDLLNTAKARYKCNGVKLRKLCATVKQTIIQGTALEAAYFSYMENFNKVNETEAIWTERLKLLDRKCEEKLDECRQNWREYAVPVVNQTYEQYKRSSNQELSAKLFTELSNTLPQRAWFVFVYNSVLGYENHGYMNFHEAIDKAIFKKWRENDKMLSIINFDLDEHDEFIGQERIEEHLAKLQELARSCTTSSPKNPKEQRGALVYLDHAITDYTALGLVTYAVKSDTNLAFQGTEDRYLRSKMDVPSRCPRQRDFLFDVFSMG
jgi:hypothetical protein